MVVFIYPNIVTVFDGAKDNYQDILIKHLKKRDIEYVDFLDTFKERKDEYLKLYNQLPRDFHISGYGNQIIAEELYEVVKKRIR